MAIYNKTDTGMLRMVTDCNISSDTFKLMLTNTAPTSATSVKADLTEIASSANYPAGGIVIGTTASQTGGVVSLTPSGDIVIAPGAGETIGPFRYVSMIDDTPADGPVISYYDRGSSVTLDGDNSDTFTIDVGATLFTIS